MVLTHSDIDHIGELKAVVEQLPVKLFVTSPVLEPINAYEDLAGVLEEKHVPCRIARAGNQLAGLPELEVTFLSPGEEVLSQPFVKDNDASLVVRLRHGEVRFLLTGDIGEEVESLLLKNKNEWQIDPADSRSEISNLRSEILKVPHHGSKYSSSMPFLKEIAPEVAVIQVGKNSYGHPHQQTIDSLEKTSNVVLRTDRHGTVEIESNGRGYRVRPWREAVTYASE